MKKVLPKARVLLSVLLVVCLMAPMLPAGILTVSAENTQNNDVAVTFAGGDGSQQNPYKIETGAQLMYMAQQINSNNGRTKHYALMEDIDLEDALWTPIGSATYPFRGTFNGNGYTVSGLNYYYDAQDTYQSTAATGRDSGGVGFFGVTGAGATIRDLHIEGSVVTDQYTVGGLIGNANGNLTLENCSFSGTVQSGSYGTAAYCGGLIGKIVGSKTVTIVGCAFEGTVTGDATVLTLYKSSSDTTLIEKTQTPESVGGFVGYVSNGCTVTVTDSHANGTVNGKDGTGGLLGTVQAPASTGSGTTTVTIARCYTEGTIESTGRVGGLIGWARDTSATEDNSDIAITIEDSYSIMDMTKATGDYASGLFGGVRTSSSAGDVTISISHCHFAGKNAKQPIAYYQADFCTLGTVEHVYYREDSATAISNTLYSYTQKKSSGAFADGTVTALLGADAWVSSNVGYPVLARQKQPALSALTVNGDTVDATKFVNKKTVGADVDSVIVAATANDALAAIVISAVNEADNTVAVQENGTVELEAGQTTTVTIEVTLNASSKTYTLYIYRDPIAWEGAEDIEPFENIDEEGAGTTENNPYQIANGAQLAYLSQIAKADTANTSGKYFVLTADIDLNGEDWTPIGYHVSNSAGTCSFRGTFDGAGHTISGLSCSVSAAPANAAGGIGLFGAVSGAIIKNLTVKGTIESQTNGYCGGIVGRAHGALTLANCTFDGSIVVNSSANTAAYNGGLIGYAQTSGGVVIDNCCSAGRLITMKNNMGGLVGFSYTGTSITCSNSCSVMTLKRVSNVTTEADNVNNTNGPGGLIGGCDANVTFNNCHFAGYVNNGCPISPDTDINTTNNLINVYYKADSYNTTQPLSGATTATSKSVAEFADGTVAEALGNTAWATSIAGYPVPSDVATVINDSFTITSVSEQDNPYSTAICFEDDSHGLGFKFPIVKGVTENVNLQEIGVLVAQLSDSNGEIEEALEDGHLYAHNLLMGDVGYYQYVTILQYTKDVSNKFSLTDKGNYDQFTAVLTNLTETQEAYNVQYIARAYARYTDENGQELVVYSEPIGDEHHNSVYEAAVYCYNPHNPEGLSLSELVYVKQVFESNYQEVLPTGNSAQLWNPQQGGADVESEALRQDILTAEDNLEITGTTYYVSPNGNDANDGTSPQTAWRSVEAVNMHYDQLQAGDAVLFERGGIYRSLVSLTEEPIDSNVALPPVPYVIQVKSGVSYGAYGEGDKPAIYGSYKNYAWDDCWEATEHQNIWKVNTPYTDAGTVVFNHGEEAGIKRFVGVDSENLSVLDENFEFYHDYANGVLYLYLDKGCPHDVYDDIEICAREGIFYIPDNTQNVTIDNLTIKYTGFYGVKVQEYTDGITVTNCEMGWIGGCKWKFKLDEGSVETEGNRIGNAIEFWETTTNAVVDNNWIYQVYDAGITPQGVSGGVYRNIVLTNNLVEFCSYNIEWFDRDSSAVWDGFYIEDNIFRFAGYGWGSQRQDSNVAPSNICGWLYKYDTSLRVFIRNNTFDCAAKNTVYWRWNDTRTYPDTVITGNTFYEKASNENKAIYYGGKTSQLYATDQASFEVAIRTFDTDPEHIEWLVQSEP